MPLIGLYTWAQYTTPTALSQAYIEASTHANNVDSPIYEATNPTWIGETFTFNGGTPTQIDVNDDDGDFEDGYVETGGAQTLAQDVVIDGVTYLAGSVVENEFSMLDAAGNEVFVVRIDGVNVGFTYAPGNEPTAGETFTATRSRDGDPLDNPAGEPSSTEAYGGVICYVAGTRIDTPSGPRAVETLRPGTKVLTEDNGAQPVRWIGRTHLRFDAEDSCNKPVLFPAGSLGDGLPQRDLAVSPQHRMLISGDIVRRHTGAGSVLAPAKAFVTLPGVRRMHGKRSVTYVHLLLDRHEVIRAEGAQSESFFPGPIALGTVSPRSRAQIEAMFPDLVSAPWNGYGPPARRVLNVHDARSVLSAMAEAGQTLVLPPATMVSGGVARHAA